MPDPNTMPDSPPAEELAIDALFRLANRIVGILASIVILGFFVFLVLLGGYFWALLTSPEAGDQADDAASIQALLLGFWDRLLPIGQAILATVAPVLVLLIAFAIFHVLSRRGATHFDLSKIATDLPSALAILIVLTICLLPLSGLPVPEVLNNVALVVVGFYFGRRKE